MSTKIVEGVEYVSEEILGKGVCLVPKPKPTNPLITEEDLIPGAEFLSMFSSTIVLIKTCSNTWYLGGRDNNPSLLWGDVGQSGFDNSRLLSYLNNELKVKKVTK